MYRRARAFSPASSSDIVRRGGSALCLALFAASPESSARRYASRVALGSSFCVYYMVGGIAHVANGLNTTQFCFVFAQVTQLGSPASPMYG